MEYLFCPECSTKNLPGRTHCLGCGKSLEEILPSSASPQTEVVSEEPPLKCLRCEGDMQNAGIRSFHEGYNWGVWGELGEMFVGRTNLTMYVCARCGHVEFFLNSVGNLSQNRLDKEEGQR